jgi:tellurite resistance protein
MSPDKAQAKVKLAEVVRRVMADGKIDPSEREEMQTIYREALLTVIDVKEVLTGYLGEVRDEVLADGKVTEEERARCRAVLAALKLPRELVPADFQALLGP